MVQMVNDLMALIVLLLFNANLWLAVCIALCFYAAIKQDWKLEVIYVIVCIALIL